MRCSRENFILMFFLSNVTGRHGLATDVVR